SPPASEALASTSAPSSEVPPLSALLGPPSDVGELPPSTFRVDEPPSEEPPPASGESKLAPPVSPQATPRQSQPSAANASSGGDGDATRGIDRDVIDDRVRRRNG